MFTLNQNLLFQQLSKEVQDSMARANETAGEAVAGVRTVRSFRMEACEACRYDDRLTDTHNLKTRRDTVRAVYLLVRRVGLLHSILISVNLNKYNLINIFN